ncbi:MULTISPECIES: ABC transporter permease [Bifidobacterium]|jgi:NitT/TauT family transport system permease protein|uniref:ABC transporter permease n=1 Tax=Bifidobacterium tibiigranuli TaxID=2172043 RepID=A0A5N6RZU2_9BIFI|nr:ABC transporter permease [Bifidobacterium tibiigranuli]KAE8127377.1 ABC transporter permease [Bifidobacterium tibiigranuli]KAE8129768.1 ABC transporter permease [Bifidobacterium tibiigranuli]MCI1212275.1 ABC transporter permease [Bifidobacterium tibiigranuli]MCI1221512.1 ABC transporter permease [Bifidobacterium tibiigranuli]
MNRKRATGILTLQIAILILFLGGWELGARYGLINTFLFSSPSNIVTILIAQFHRGTLMLNVQVTAYETLVGYLVGAIGGSALGLLLWFSRFVADLTKPFIAALGSIPVLAVAPMLIIWFGTGFRSKVVVAAFSCIVVALINAYQGTEKVDKDQLELFRSFRATKFQTFRKLIIPASTPWLMVSLKLNVGFALVGAIVGEFISANAGVGHMIVVAGASFEIGEVLAGIVLVMLMVLVFNMVIALIDRILKHRHFT